MEKETPAKKAAAPSVSQINAEYVTQVIITVKVQHCAEIRYSIVCVCVLKRKKYLFNIYIYQGHALTYDGSTMSL